MGLFDRILGRAAATEEDALAGRLLGRLAAATDARLAGARGLDTLREPALAAHEYLRDAIARIPGVTEVSSAAWSGDPTLRALFARDADAALPVNRDRGARAWLDAHPGADCVGLLALEQQERRVLATAMQGDLLAEVARTSVSFANPRILAPGADEQSVRGELVDRAVDYLALRALERAGAARVERRELEQQQKLLDARLRLARRRGTGLGAIAAADEGEEKDDAAAIERELERTVRALEGAPPGGMLERLVEELRAVVSAPQEHLGIEPCEFALDAMNLVAAAGADAVIPRVAILQLAGRAPYAVVVARFARVDLRSPGDMLAEAAKYL